MAYPTMMKLRWHVGKKLWVRCGARVAARQSKEQDALYCMTPDEIKEHARAFRKQQHEYRNAKQRRAPKRARMIGTTGIWEKAVVGGTLCAWISAPGWGKIVYRVTRIEPSGRVWAKVIEDTSGCD